MAIVLTSISKRPGPFKLSGVSKGGGLSRLLGLRRPTPVMDHVLPSPRLTAAGAVALLVLLGVPALAIGFVLDLIVWIVGREVFGLCIGLWCAA